MKAFAQADDAAEDRIFSNEALAIPELFLGAGLRVTSDRPDAASEVGPSGGQIWITSALDIGPGSKGGLLPAPSD